MHLTPFPCRAGLSAARGRPVRPAREAHRPCHRPCAPRRCIVGRLRPQPAGRGPRSTLFLRASMTAGDPSSGAERPVTTLKKQGRTLTRTLPSRPFGPTRGAEDSRSMRARCCGVRLTPCAQTILCASRRHHRPEHQRRARARSIALHDARVTAEWDCGRLGHQRPRQRARRGRRSAERAVGS